MNPFMHIIYLFVLCISCPAICNYRIEFRRVFVISFIIVGIQFLRNLPVAHIHTKHVSCFQQAFKAAIIFIIQIIRIGLKSSPSLLGKITAGMTGTCRHADTGVKRNVLIQEKVQHSCGKSSPHTASLQDETCFTVPIHKVPSFCLSFLL